MSTRTVTQIKTSEPRLHPVNGNKTRKSVVLRLRPVNANNTRKKTPEPSLRPVNDKGHVLDPNRSLIINNSGNSPKTRRNTGTLLSQLENSNLMPIYFPGKVGDFEDWREYFQDSLENVPLHDIILSSIHASNIIPSYDSDEFMKEYSDFINTPELNLLKDTFNLMPSKSERLTVGGEFNGVENTNIEKMFKEITSKNLTHYTNAQEHANRILMYLKHIQTKGKKGVIQDGMLPGFISNDVTNTKVTPFDICKNLLWFINISSSVNYKNNTQLYSQFILHFYFGLNLNGKIDDDSIQLTKADHQENIPDDTKLKYTIKQYTDNIKKPLHSGDNAVKWGSYAKILFGFPISMSDITQEITKDHISKFRSKEHLEFYCISALNQILCYLVEDESIFYLFLTFLSHIASLHNNNPNEKDPNKFFKTNYFSEKIYDDIYAHDDSPLQKRSRVLYHQILKVKGYFKIDANILNCGVFFNFREASIKDKNLSSKIYKILDVEYIDEYTCFINTLVRMVFKKGEIMSLVPSETHKILYEKLTDDIPLYSVNTKEVYEYTCDSDSLVKSKIDDWGRGVEEVEVEGGVPVGVSLGEELNICNSRWHAKTKEIKFRTLSDPRVKDITEDSTAELCGILSRLVYCDTSVIQGFFKGDSNIKYLMPLDPDPEWLGEYPDVIKHRIHVFYKENPAVKNEFSVFIVFRGSLTSRDWLETNLDITLASKRGVAFNHRIINFPVFISRIKNKFNDLKLKNAIVRFYSTGHSLGGYLALMLSSYSYSLFPFSGNKNDPHNNKKDPYNISQPKGLHITYYKIIEPIVFNPFGGTLNRRGKALAAVYNYDSHSYRDAFTSYLEIIRSGEVHRIKAGPSGISSFYDIASGPIVSSINNTSLQLIEYQNIYDSNNKKELTTIDGLTLDDTFNYAQSHAMYQFIGLVSFYIDSLTLKGNSGIISSDQIQDIISIKPFKEDITLSTNINLVLLELNDKYKFLSNTFWANVRRMVNPGSLSPSSPYSQVYPQVAGIRTSSSLRSTRKSKLLRSPYNVSRKRRVSLP